MTASRRPSTSTVKVCRAPASAVSAEPWYGSTVPVNSVSIQRVCTPKAPSVPTKAGSSRTACWNGSTVGMPSMLVSANARRERCRAWVRSAPVTMILATSESNELGTVMPAR